jgi:hypothetical protein
LRSLDLCAEIPALRPIIIHLYPLSIMNQLTRFTLLALPVVFWLSSCASAPPSVTAADQGPVNVIDGYLPEAARRNWPLVPPGQARAPVGTASRKERSETSPLSRPGLATTAGHDYWSTVSNSAFYRKFSGQPDAVDSFHYNDEAGAKAMADSLGGGTRRAGAFAAANGLIKVGLDGADFDRFWPRLEANNRRIVVGEPGRSYSIVLKNETRQRLEVVASVDGLDVMDGGIASVKKRGYVLEPKAELSIDGFRTSRTYVKRFQFGSVAESAAAKKGSVRNVGVIGLAVYEEDMAAARAAELAEAQKRGGASAFPGQ